MTYQPNVPLRDARREFEKNYIAQAIVYHGGNMSRAARQCDMERSAFHRKARDLGIQFERIVEIRP